MASTLLLLLAAVALAARLPGSSGFDFGEMGGMDVQELDMSGMDLGGMKTGGMDMLSSNMFGNAEKEAGVSPCKICKDLAGSFNKGLEATARGRFDGGDSHWERKNLKNYGESELRLTEIQEKICEDVHDGKHRCVSLSEEHEEHIEKWWFNDRLKQVDLFKNLCVDKLAVCCLAGHFGPDCTPCKGHPDAICGGNGKCDGDGSRQGTGDCKCNRGYQGELCADCADNYLKVDEKCQQCHRGCKGGCTKLGPFGCAECKPGFYEDKELGCADVNECLPIEGGKNPCRGATFCLNTLGSHECLRKFFNVKKVKPMKPVKPGKTCKPKENPDEADEEEDDEEEEEEDEPEEKEESWEKYNSSCCRKFCV